MYCMCWENVQNSSGDIEIVSVEYWSHSRIIPKVHWDWFETKYKLETLSEVFMYIYLEMFQSDQNSFRNFTEMFLAHHCWEGYGEASHVKQNTTSGQQTEEIEELVEDESR
jgi:hypothetical protein